MSHCYICDKQVNEVRIDPRDGKSRPCSECEAVIQETLEEYDTETPYGRMESGVEEYDEEVRGSDRELEQT